MLIDELGDVRTVSRLLHVLSEKGKATPVRGGGAAPAGKKPTPVHTSGSKLTGREGYTAYHFVADKEIQSKGYLFKSLKRLIEEEAVEKIERVQHTKDLTGFVFDLPSELDETFQGSWRDGKYDMMQLLEGEIPALSDAPDGGTQGRGGFRGRGNDRGGFRGRGTDRGGYRGRGGNDRGSHRGRGNDRGGGRGAGMKRPASSGENGNPKVVKFD